MDDTDLQPLLEDLTGNIDDLEETLAPLLKTALSQSTSKLPLLDKAKAYVLATYAIESILFSSLRLNGVDAKSHPVFQELARVKEYFAKIKTAENGGSKPTSTLNKDAAGRFVKHGLAGNQKYDRERAYRMAQQKAGAKRKLEEMGTGTHTRFDGSAKKVKAEEAGAGAEEEDEVSEEEGGVKIGDVGNAPKPQKKPKSSKEALNSLASSSAEKSKTKSRKRHKKSNKQLEERRAAEMK
ncbi:uncharacterized protein LTR77_010032 [Saxophila tyrrhenica]|uniref:Exosome complex protein n=1 Tax=Saxophila tyrrhenica TaxID=1690608 RepID=A0AAV9NX00_9PEZI|nr:hypothetical protein LTR77_010032 [Saxophila tyrrhenica]